MADELMMIQGDDGVFREYKDDYDVTIHFETKEEQDDFFRKIENPVIRCKDCKHCIALNCGYSCELSHWGKISKESNYGGMGDWYCGDGEEKHG